MDVVKIFRDGLESTLTAISAGDSITKIMTEPSPICPLMGNEIMIGKKLGKGVVGEVFQIKFPGMGMRNYAVKRVDVFADYYINNTGKTTFLDLQKSWNIKAEKIIVYNGLNLLGTKPADPVPRKVWIPTFVKGCKLKKIVKYERFDSRGQTIFNAGDQVCPPMTSEFGISILAGSLYRSRRSINFLDVFYFATCKDEIITDLSVANQYTFMERITASLRKSISCLCEQNLNKNVSAFFLADPVSSERAMNSVVVQIIHAIYTYQSVYQVVHGDLHDDNVFFEFLTPDTEWNGEKLLEADYYEYKVDSPGILGSDTQSIYIPGGRECPFIIKIGDWGLACKYSSPKIANQDTMFSGYDQLDGNGPWLPNWYNEMYDMYFIMSILYTLNPSNEFIASIMSWMLDVPPGIPDAIRGASIIGPTSRPIISRLDTPEFAGVTPQNLLLDPIIMKEFHKVPPTGSKIILLGE
jgi:serine/threonine protein kinase